MDIEQVWKVYKSSISPDNEAIREAKEQLIVKYASLVKYVAGRLAINLPPHIEVNDLINDGIIGLIDAIDKFDLSRGIKFETYASTRIHGAIVDALRDLDWVPRRVRKRARELEQAYQQLESRLGRAATEDEIAKELNITKEEFAKELLQVSGTAVLSLDDLFLGDDGDLSLMEVIREKGAGPEEEAMQGELQEALKQSIKDLPEKEHIVITLYYFEELTLKEITRVLSLSEARVSQLHTQAIFRLKGKLRALVSAHTR